MNTANINPAQTDNSKTAAIGDASLNINIERIALVIARPMAERSSLVAIAVQSADITNAVSITKFVTISTFHFI
jgi:hypothetical protein